MHTSYDKARTAQIIKDLHAKGKTWAEIETALNKAGLTTISGLPWDKCASGYALRLGIVPRKNNTNRGMAGSTGGYSKYNGKAPATKAPVTRKKTITDSDIEEIMTSNLVTSLKLKVIRMVAING
jgi:hypothetical protein